MLEDWFNTYYDRSGNACQAEARRLISSSDVITNEIDVISQEIHYNSDGVSSITIIYNQLITFKVADTRQLLDCGSDPNAPTLNVDDMTVEEEIATLPFYDQEANGDLAKALQENIAGLADVEEKPIPVAALKRDRDGNEPGGSEDVGSLADSNNDVTNEDDTMPVAPVTAIAVATTTVTTPGVFFLLCWYKRKAREPQEADPEAVASVIPDK